CAKRRGGEPSPPRPQRPACCSRRYRRQESPKSCASSLTVPRRAGVASKHPSSNISADRGSRWKRRLSLRVTFQGSLVLDAVVAGETADQLALHPILQQPAEVLPRHAGNRSEVALADLVTDQDATRTDVLAEGISEAQQRPRGSRSDRGRAHCQADAVVA